MLLAYLFGLADYLSLSKVAEQRDFLKNWTASNLTAALALYVALYIAAVALSIPGAVVLTILGGFLFGWLIGGLATVIAATLGAAAIFLIAKTSLGVSLRKRAGPFINKLAEGFEKDAFNYLLFLRLVPLFPFWLVNVAPAFANVSLRTFSLATLIGIIPGTFAFSFLGNGLDSIIDGQKVAQHTCIAEKSEALCPLELSASNLITKELLIAFAVMGLAALIPVILKKWKTKS